MFKLAVIVLISLLDNSAPASADNDVARCSNSGGGRCSIGEWKAGRARLTTSEVPGTLRIVPPTSSRQPAFDLLFQGFAKDCSAEITCSNGASVACSATGENTQCTSNATSVGCLTVNSTGKGTSGSSATCPAP